MESFGTRLRHHRERAGMTRAVLGGLVGRSDQWVKALENDRLLQPRLPMLLHLARVLRVQDLGQLTGDVPLSVETFTKASHDALPVVATAMSTYILDGDDLVARPVEELSVRVAEAWRLWHGQPLHRSAVARVLPELIRDVRVATTRADEGSRRATLRLLAQTCHLTQLYLSFQPCPGLVLMCSDRAMHAAQDADDPASLAAAAWYANHAFREAGEQAEARVGLAEACLRLLDPESSEEHRALAGLMHLAIALSHARLGREGDALRQWDAAASAARALGPAYSHPWLLFGAPMVDAYAVTIQADLAHGAAASRLADDLPLSAIPSMTRRAFHLIEAARSYHLRGESIAVVSLLTRALDTSPETADYNVFARAAVQELTRTAGATIRADVVRLAGRLDIPA